MARERYWGRPSKAPRIIACVSYSINSDKALKQTCTSYYIEIRKPGLPDGMFSGLALNQHVPEDQFDIAGAPTTPIQIEALGVLAVRAFFEVDERFFLVSLALLRPRLFLAGAGVLALLQSI
jgi:hypothetical protein